MSDEDLELLVTLDDPEGAPEEDTFHDGTVVERTSETRVHTPKTVE